jgi:peroxiredoxin
MAMSAVPALLAGCSIARGSGAQAIPATGGVFQAAGSRDSVGKEAPDFTGVDVMTGQTVTLGQFKGQTVLLNFVNYGCNPSLNRVVSEQLLAIRQLYGERTDFVPFSVFCGCCSPEALKEFATNNGLQWPWVLDTDGSIIAGYSALVGEFGYPTLVFIDKDQKMTEITCAVSQADLSARLDRAAANSGTVGSAAQ